MSTKGIIPHCEVAYYRSVSFALQEGFLSTGEVRIQSVARGDQLNLKNGESEVATWDNERDEILQRNFSTLKFSSSGVLGLDRTALLHSDRSTSYAMISWFHVVASPVDACKHRV